MTDTRTVGPIARVESTAASILSYAVVVVGIFLLANGAFLSGGLFLLGSAVITPRFPFFSGIPSFIGWVLIAVGVGALP